MKIKTFILAVSAICLASCSKSTQPEHLVFIGLDGLSSEAFETADMPFVKSLLPQASYTVKKRSVLPSSSAVNWATMFMGATPDLHGYTTWGSKTPEIPSRVILKNGIFPTVFQLYRDKFPQAEMGCTYDWSGIKYIVDTLSFSYYAHPQFGKYSDVSSLTTLTCDYISAKKPDVSVVVYNNPDKEGHNSGWCGEEYMAVLPRLDSAIRVIFKAAGDVGMTCDNTVFVITADHGGRHLDTGHGGKTLNEMETPFIILGKGIKKGYCFDDVSMMQFDIASTIAAMYNLEQPQVWCGKSMPVFD